MLVTDNDSNEFAEGVAVGEASAEAEQANDTAEEALARAEAAEDRADLAVDIASNAPVPLPYDDSALWSAIEDMRSRLDSLESTAIAEEPVEEVVEIEPQTESEPEPEPEKEPAPRRRHRFGGR